MTARPLVAVLDYGIGNLRSAQKALERVGAAAIALTRGGELLRLSGDVHQAGLEHGRHAAEQAHEQNRHGHGP